MNAQDDWLQALIHEQGQFDIGAMLSELKVTGDASIASIFAEALQPDEKQTVTYHEAPAPEILALADEFLTALGVRKYQYESLWATTRPLFRKHEGLLCRWFRYSPKELYREKVTLVVSMILRQRGYCLKRERRRGLKRYESWYSASKLSTDDLEEMAQKLYGLW